MINTTANNNPTLQNLLNDAINCGIIDLDSVHENIMASKREKVRKLHPYAITPPAKEDGRWQTCYKDSNGNRKNIKAQTEVDLLDKLIPIYEDQMNLDKTTFYDLFQNWLKYKKTITDSPNTILRHKQQYRKYLQTSSLHEKKISKITELQLEEECNRIVKEFKLSRKEWTNLKTILRGMYFYAVRNGDLKVNLMEKVQIHVKFRQVVKKTGKTETYNTEELIQLNKYLDAMYAETEDVAFLAVKLNFLLGLRVGELVALKPTDFDDENHLHIVREEVKDQEANKYYVVDHTKTNEDRFVVVIPKAKELLAKIEPQGEYLFMRNGERLTARQVAYVLEKYAERQGVKTKSTHKMRKTYASNLSSKGVPLDAIREQLGHASLNTTLSYIFNPLTEQETYDLMVKAL